jgi:hypothetical protein
MKRALGFKEAVLFTADITAGESVDTTGIESQINQWRAQMQAGDQLVVFVCAHGGWFSDEFDETTATPGDEYVKLGPDLLVDDDWMTSLLSGMDSVEKWVLLDSCYSGGFVGDYNPLDDGDLEKLSDIGVLAASPEDRLAIADLETGRGLLSERLIDAFLLDDGAFLNADLNRDNELTFNELSDWVGLAPEGWGSCFEMEFGDPVVWSPDLWNPMSFTSTDFGGAFGCSHSEGGTQIPAPGAVMLVGIGSGLVGFLHRRGIL